MTKRRRLWRVLVAPARAAFHQPLSKSKGVCMSTYARPKGKRESRKSSADFTIVYLIHFNKAYRHARHYIGFTTNLDKRITDHLCGMGARLMEVITNAGIEWRVARTWQGDR